jgi:hypothetical protein
MKFAKNTSKTTWLKLTLAGLALSAVAAISCDKDDDKDSGSRSPRAENNIPGNFNNTTDEKGYKAKLGDFNAMIQSSEGLQLSDDGKVNRQSNVSTRSFTGSTLNRFLASLWRQTPFRTRDVSQVKRGISTYQALIAEILPSFARQDTSLAQKPSLKPLRQGFKALMPKDGIALDDESEPSSLEQTYKVGDNCSALMLELSDYYRSASSGLNTFVTEVGAVDWSQEKYLTKVAVDPATEAFAYTIRLDNQSFQLQETAGQINLDGRFSGGANDNQIMFKAGGRLAVSSDGTTVTGAVDINAFSDIPQKTLALGAAFSVAAKSSEEAVAANFSTSTRVIGGNTPSFIVSLEGNANAGEQVVSGKAKLSLDRLSTESARMTVSYSFSDGQNSQEGNQTIDMKITSDQFAQETCEVTAVR